MKDFYIDQFLNRTFWPLDFYIVLLGGGKKIGKKSIEITSGKKTAGNGDK